MKRINLLLVLTLVITCFSITGCVMDQYSADQIVGTWYTQEEEMYYRFDDDLTGRSYNKNGVGLDFTWSLSGGKTIAIRYTGSYASAWDSFVITALSDNLITCYDEFDAERELHLKRQ